MSKYLQIRDQIKTGDLLSWRSDSLLGVGIRLFTKGKVNHSSTAIALPDYGRERKYCTEALEHGCELNHLSTRLKEFKGDVYWHPLRPEFEEYRQAIGTAAFSRIGVKYDYTSIFKQMFGRVSLSARRLFCSEYVYQNMADAAVPGTDKNIVAPNPQELFVNRVFWDEPVLIKGE